MAITPGMCNSFKAELLGMAIHVSTDVFKFALFTSAATIGPTSTAYAVTNEVAATGGYTAGGFTLSGLTASLDGTVGILDFADVTVSSATITARGGMIYNSSKGNKAVAVFDFGADITSTNGTWSAPMPAPAAATAVLRVA